MKRLFLMAGLMAAFMLLVVAASAQKASFAGTWSLDKSKSQGLSQRIQGADKVTWTVTQDDKIIAIDQKVEGAPAGGGSGGGGGTGGGGGMGGGGGRGPGGPAGPQSYNLDGKEVTTQGQNGGSTSMKSSWSGSTLELTTVRSGSFNGQDFKATSSDKLSLSGDGKTLTVSRHNESPRGTTDSTWVFNKQSFVPPTNDLRFPGTNDLKDRVARLRALRLCCAFCQPA